ncbi:MAG: N-acetylneuraminate synthase family protein, partial [Oscillospiraceae bacterium]|nr:N-acetylneuraminate synthase family protein [Oscillospiraceae bacterium]
LQMLTTWHPRLSGEYYKAQLRSECLDESAIVDDKNNSVGAEVIEKHFTLNKTLKGNDHYHAGDPTDFAKFVANVDVLMDALGSSEKTVFPCEMVPRREARRSLVLTRDMKAGEVITETDLMPKRPGTGINPRYMDIVVGRKVLRDLEEDTILTWEMI